MPDLGKYADTVLSAYAISILILIVLVALSFWQSRQAKARLAEIEARRESAKAAAPAS
ncbi:heme exporter protein CcmD [Litoreibacter janthinus]|uniref:Heme exporter protein D n=1 Tax=Litoreibacter janthinus TaxID=670154 RepID=A0A1I6GRN1_9RHOB|nr:heme exporter protein CcmD [Litoreibacter janthinus]SFR44786.1 heme exporter protein D [Litoreibacter janthinus]